MATNAVLEPLDRTTDNTPIGTPRRAIAAVVAWPLRLKIGVLVVGVFLLFGFLLPVFSPSDPTVWNALPSNLPPSAQHLFGTTDLGQDTFWFLAFAVRSSLIIGLIVAVLATAIGVIVGLVAGYLGGVGDRVLTLLTDTFIVIPSLPILILIASLLKGRASLELIALVLVAFNWPWPARQTRAMALSLREREFINTARFSGASTLRIIRLEVFPYIRTWAMANLVNTVLVAIGAEAGLAVIGLSNMQRATLGTMIYWAMQHQALLLGAWFWVGSPVVAIMILFLGLFALSTGVVQYSTAMRGR
jgi:peptide/nickel transport system permease protein